MCFWDPFTKANITLLEKVQRKAFKFIENFSPYDSPTQLMQPNNMSCTKTKNCTFTSRCIYVH